MQAVAARVLGIAPKALLQAVFPALACSVIVAITGLGIFLLPYLGGLPTAVLVVAAAIGAVYAALRFCFTALHDELLVLLRRKRPQPA